MSGANASGYLESRTMKTETPTVKMVAIAADEAGQRIDNFLRTQLKGVPKSMIYRILRKGEVRVNKKRVKPEYKLEAGDEVRIPPVRVAEREEEAVSPHLQKVAALAMALPTINVGDAAIGVVTLGTLIFWPRLGIRLPGHLPALLAGCAVMLVVNLLGGDVATIGSQFHYQLADGTQGNGIPQLLPQLVLPWDMPGSSFTLSWASLQALLPAAFSMAMLGAIESLLCAVVLDGMTGTKHKANSELIGQGLGNIVAPFFGGITATAAIARSAANVRAGATSPVAAVIHALLVILALLILAPLLSWLPLSAMAALLLMVAWNMSEAHKVINLLRHAPKDDIVVMLMCMSLTVLFDMVIAISVGIVLASLLFMRRIARMTHLAPVNVEVPDDVLVLRVIGPLFFAAAEGLFNDLETRIAGKRIVVLKWDAVPVLDAGGLDAFQRFVNKLPEGCELRVSNLEFQPLRTLARAGVKPLPGRLSFYPDRQAALADL